jgi:hypothetical protein
VGNIKKKIKNDREERAGEISTTKNPSVKTNLCNQKHLSSFLTSDLYEKSSSIKTWFYFLSF